ncbi:MAG TPA: xanthine dehydrogenase family protein molybdopterin-binding subunit, partial [Chloroflexota bacterium]|nr:xanthine dehydrogenase family protein molybdopterin-binding subunit [Chloroflexota bacterium]
MTVAEHTAPTGELGRARTRVEDRRLVTGHGRFLEDIQLPGTVHLAIVRSPHPHARIVRIDTAAALAVPGVQAVLTGADVPPMTRLPIVPLATNLKVPPYEPLAVAVARAVGQPVAAVVADDRATAVDAAALVDVEYEVLDAVADAEAALADGAPLLYPEFGSNVCYTFERGSGDVDAAFASAHRTVSLKVAFSRIAPAPLEPRGVLAHFDPHSEELTVWATTQSPSGMREQLALALDLPEHRIRVVVPDMGGGFGARNPVYPEFLAAAWASRRLGRPVRWVSTRSEDISTTTHARDQVVYLEAAADREGHVTGLRARVIGNLGSFLYINTQLPPWRIPAMLPGCYKIGAYHAELVTAFTNTTPTGPYRGAGRPQAADCIERLIDVLARELEIDPIELRRRNFIPANEFPYTTAAGITYDSGNYEGALDLLLKSVDLPALREQQRQERARGERTLMGIGLATFVEPSASGWESGYVRIEPSGRVTAATGSVAHGQGHETSFAQLLSHHLGVPFDQIVIRHGDTAVCPPGVGTFGSRSTVLGGTALLQA